MIADNASSVYRQVMHCSLSSQPPASQPAASQIGMPQSRRSLMSASKPATSKLPLHIHRRRTKYREQWGKWLASHTSISAARYPTSRRSKATNSHGQSTLRRPDADRLAALHSPSCSEINWLQTRVRYSTIFGVGNWRPTPSRLRDEVRCLSEEPRFLPVTEEPEAPSVLFGCLEEAPAPKEGGRLRPPLPPVRLTTPARSKGARAPRYEVPSREMKVERFGHTGSLCAGGMPTRAALPSH
ncbi:unnamed protein product [Cutaneotrichosporon oleaginosum]